MSGPDGGSGSADLPSLVRELWRHHRGWLFQCAYNSGARHRAEAEAIIQDASLRVMRTTKDGAAEFDSVDRLKGYYLKTIRSVAIDRARKLDKTLVGDTETLATGPTAEVPPTPEGFLIRREDRRTRRREWKRVLEAIELLPRRWCSVLKLRYLNGSSTCVRFRNIAQQLGTTEAAVRGYHHRALDRLRTLLADRSARE